MDKKSIRIDSKATTWRKKDNPDYVDKLSYTGPLSFFIEDFLTFITPSFLYKEEVYNFKKYISGLLVRSGFKITKSDNEKYDFLVKIRAKEKKGPSFKYVSLIGTIDGRSSRHCHSTIIVLRYYIYDKMGHLLLKNKIVTDVKQEKGDGAYSWGGVESRFYASAIRSFQYIFKKYHLSNIVQALQDA